MDMRSFRLTAAPAGFIDDPYPYYGELRRESPVRSTTRRCTRACAA